MLGISLEMQEKTLRLIKALSDKGKRMSGVIILIDNVGHGFCGGVNSNDLKSSAEYFRDKELKYSFKIVEMVNYEPAGDIMAKIHALNDTKKLPGLFKYLELLQKAA
jgi:hypothetical protein